MSQCQLKKIMKPVLTLSELWSQSWYFLNSSFWENTKLCKCYILHIHQTEIHVTSRSYTNLIFLFHIQAIQWKNNYQREDNIFLSNLCFFFRFSLTPGYWNFLITDKKAISSRISLIFLYPLFDQQKLCIYTWPTPVGRKQNYSKRYFF